MNGAAIGVNAADSLVIANDTHTLRRNTIYKAAKLALRNAARSKPLQKLAEGRQVYRVEGRAPGGNPSKLVWRINVGQIG